MSGHAEARAMSGWQRLGVAVLLLAILLLRAATIPRAAFNWDELALFDSVARSIQDGVLRSGGRPGLAHLVVMPLVEACRDEARVAQAARALWLGITSAYLVGLFALLFELLRGRERRVHDACLGVALLALVPAFLEWSLQVRTDQLALCGAVWGGVALLRSERQTGLALCAGLAFGLGWLATQKLAYAAALVGVLAVGRLFVEKSFSAQREGWRAMLVVAGFGTVLLCFRALVMWLFTLPETHAARQVLVGSQVASAHQSVFPFYRNTIGYSQYLSMLPTLLPHAALGLGLLGTTALCARRDRDFGWIAVAWGVLALGLLVALYHAAAFSYFWMTLGLFPAVAGALAAGAIRERLLRERPGWQRAAALLLWGALLVPALAESVSLLRDRQAVQRESLRFVHRNFAPDRRGFHPEGGLFCVAPESSGVWFSQRIFRVFESPEREARTRALEQHFRRGPVHYLVESFRLRQFPPELQRFWAEHYQPYRGSVYVAGRRLGGEQARDETFDLIVSGPYRWLPFDAAHPLRLDGRELEAGAVLELSAGEHVAALPAGARGVLVLSLTDPPGPAPLAFYGPS